MKGGIQILILLFIFLFHSLSAQELDIETHLEKDSMLIGEQLNYSIILKSAGKIHSMVPIDDELFPGNFEIISQAEDSIIEGGRNLYQNDYLITCFDSGSYKINSIPVLVNSFERLDTLFTPELNLIVYSPEVDTTAAIKDIKPPEQTPFKLAELMPYAPYAGGLAILVIAGLLLMNYYRRKKKGIVSQQPRLPAHVQALNELDRIKKEKLWQQGRVKDYYSQLSDTVRIYIEERFEIPAMESVTGEILDAFKKYSWDDENLMEILESLLQLSDLVKFAKEDPT
ncbi:MAG: hypothetical protein ACP5E3_17875, partial [Bacteroidales bacterium]